jgi:hypothetical protein
MVETAACTDTADADMAGTDTAGVIGLLLTLREQPV